MPTPLWDPIPATSPALDRDLSVDVAVVGAGLSGLTAAARLAEAGLRVAVLERDRVGAGETGRTTSHLTEAVDGRYSRITRTFGNDGARLVAQSSHDAINELARLAERIGPACAFTRTAGYLYTEATTDLEWLADELDAARRAGCPVDWVDNVPLPFATKGGIRWQHQALIHPTALLSGLAADARTHGVQIFEATPVVDVAEGDGCMVKTDCHVVRARAVFVATNVPVNNRVLLQTKIAAYRSYAIAADATRDTVRGLFWDTADPYHYTRAHEVDGRWYLIVGGADHRTGERTDTEACFDQLGSYARDRFEIGAVRYRWSGQIIEPVDGLPYIGRNPGSDNVYVATGYSGNGMTFGVLAGQMVADAIQRRENPYAALYDPSRVTPTLAAAARYVTENAPFPVHLVTDRLTSIDADIATPGDLAPGEGGIMATADGKVAVCRDWHGALRAVSPVCTHMGCDVAWNRAEQTWDCPCHGSRFSPEGEVINGPAVAPLEQQQVPETTPR